MGEEQKFTLDLSLRCLLNIQVEISVLFLDIQIQNLKEKSGLEIQS